MADIPYVGGQPPQPTLSNNVLFPGQYNDQLEAYRRQQMAEMLMKGALTEPQGQMLNGIYVGPGMGQQIARVLMGVLGKNSQNEGDQLLRNVAVRQQESTAPLFGGQGTNTQPQIQTQSGQNPLQNVQSSSSIPTPIAQGASSPVSYGSQSAGPQITSSQPNQSIQQVPQQTQPQFQSQQQNGPLQIPGMSPGQSRLLFGLSADPTTRPYAENLMKLGDNRTDFTKLLAVANNPNTSPQDRESIMEMIKKETNIPLQAGRPGSFMYDSKGNIVAASPKIPDNSIPQIVNGKVVGVNNLPNAQAIEQQNAYAQAAGRNEAEPIAGYVNGVPTYTNKLAVARGGIGINKGNVNQPNGQFAPVPALGAETGANSAQKELSDKWTNLTQQNQQAQSTVSYLQNIKTLAQKAAVGPASDQLQFKNALLSLVGVQGATDATTANNLIDKYQGQIISRLGVGGMGTDAARAIIESSIPGAKMNVQAINEAVDNINGAQSMIKAKTQLLSQDAASRNPISYQQKEVIFDQNADPRIWQWKSIQDPLQRKAFAAKVIQQDPQFPQKIKALENIGVF